jgi:mannosyltransferase OCH1-like enzyme
MRSGCLFAYIWRVCFWVFIYSLSGYYINAQHLFVDFATGMLYNTAADSKFIQIDANWQLGKQLYSDFISCFSVSTVSRIPHIMHHVWLGSPLPGICEQLRDTWHIYHPSWQSILWTDHEENYRYGRLVTTIDELRNLLQEGCELRIVFDVRNFPLIHRKAYMDTQNFGERSDILRYEILHAFGGLYVDTDFECLKSFDIFHKACDFYVGIGYSRTYGLLNGLIGCAPGDRIIERCIKDLVGKLHPNDMSSVIGRTGPGLLTRSFCSELRSGYEGIAVGFPVSTFYPWPNWDRRNRDPLVVKSWIRPESYAVHHWHVSWQSNPYK